MSRTPSDVCPTSLKSACASAQSDQSLRCPHEETFASLAVQYAPSEDADLNLRWAHMSEGTLSDVAALLNLVLKKA